MFKTNVLRADREFTPRRSATPAALGGVAVLAISLLLSVGPALGAANNGNNGNRGTGGTGSSNVKVHDASSGLEALGGDNEPHVCDFWLEFSMPSPYEAGTWAIESWAPTGDGSTVASGTYNTTGDASDASSVIHVIAGHYRVEWVATGETVPKKKMFWVDAGCYDTSTPAETPAETPVEPPVETPAGEPAVSPEESPAGSPAGETPSEQSPAEGPTSPAEEPTSPAEEPATPAEDSPAEQPASPADDSAADSPAEEPTSPTEESSSGAIPPADEPPAPTDESSSGAIPPADESPAPTDDQDVLSENGSGNAPGAEDPTPPTGGPVDQGPAADDQATDDPGTPSDGSPSAPTDESGAEEPAQAAESGADPATSPTQDQLGSRNDPGGSAMPDTSASTPPAPSGVVATLGLLLVIAGHAATRRSRRPDQDELNTAISSDAIRLP